jgi:hypothetical protein
MERLSSVTRSQLAWGAYTLGALLLIVAVAVVIGFVLAVLPLVWGAVVALLLVALLVALLLPEARTFWSRLPR